MIVYVLVGLAGLGFLIFWILRAGRREGGLLGQLESYAERRERAEVAPIQDYALDAGWSAFGPPVPPPVDVAVRSPLTKLALTCQVGGHQVWMVWQRWPGSDADGRGPLGLTRFYVWLEDHYPDMQVRRRDTLSLLVLPVQGIGTGEPEFDRHYMIKSTGSDAPLRVLTPAVRQVMIAGRAREWEISAGTLIHTYEDKERVETLQGRAEGVANFAQLLLSGRPT